MLAPQPRGAAIVVARRRPRLGHTMDIAIIIISGIGLLSGVGCLAVFARMLKPDFREAHRRGVELDVRARAQRLNDRQRTAPASR